METLSLGKHNSKLTDLRKAVEQGTLTSEGLLPIEGPKLVEEAKRSGIHIDSVFLRKGTEFDTTGLTSKIYEVEPDVFRYIQSTETSQGVIAAVRMPSFNLPDLLRARNPLLVVMARLQDPGNVGTIFRVAECFDSSGCIGLKGTASVFNSKTVRASAGSLFRLPYAWDLDGQAVFDAIKDAGIKVIGTSPAASESIDHWDWSRPAAVVIGNEGSGLSEEEIHNCDSVLRIPHNAEVESLNSATAAAVVLYEAFRQRHI